MTDTNTETDHARRRVRSRPATDLANKCRRCSGPCHFYAGSTYGWTCRRCIRRDILGDRADSDLHEPLPMLSDLPSRNSLLNGLRCDDHDAH